MGAVIFIPTAFKALVTFIVYLVVVFQADDERMMKSFVGDFFLTGDRASMDDRGYVWFKARSDDVILSSGLV